MKKSILIPVIIAVVVAAVLTLFFIQRQTPVIRAAKRHELSGDLQQALSLYAEAVFDGIPSIEIPDINRSKFLAPELLKKEVEKYIAWIVTPSQKIKPDIAAALEGMARCESQGRRENTISEPVILPLTEERYLDEWNKTFFAPKVAIDPSHAALASGNYLRNLSLLVIKSTKNYTYEINCINMTTHRGSRCILLAENSVRLYVLPGEHLLLCRSTVIFPSEAIWRSHYTPIRITIPHEPSLVTAELRTSVYRKGKPEAAARKE
ncbi:MAG: hypothetical protein JXA18_08195 [Chitinispirillaceae bacterium]|nr:hypothetical protein [Chitinispirillaceae bacterium]